MKKEEEFMNDLKNLCGEYIDKGLKLKEIIKMMALYVSTLKNIIHEK